MIPILWFFAGFGLIAFGVKEMIIHPADPSFVWTSFGIGFAPGAFAAAMSAAFLRRSVRQQSNFAGMNAMIGGFAMKLMGAAFIGLAAFTWRTPQGSMQFDPVIALCTFLAPVFFGFAWQAYFVEALAARERREREEAQGESPSDRADPATADAQQALDSET